MTLPMDELERRAKARGGALEVEDGIPKFILAGYRYNIRELEDPPARKPKEHRCPACGDKHVGLMGP